METQRRGHMEMEADWRERAVSPETGEPQKLREKGRSLPKALG